MSSIFSSILAGEIPCHKVWEDHQHLAFLDINPIQPGHCLVIPKQEISYIFDMTAKHYENLWEAVRTVEKKIRSATGCQRVVISVIGWEVPHVHVHLIPTNEISDYSAPPPCHLDASEFAGMATRISEACE